MNRQHAPEVAGGASMSGVPTALEHEGLALHVIAKSGPVTIADLASALGLSRRDVEQIVERHRLRGEPIVGGNDGLHLTSDPDELAAYVEARRRRIATMYLGSRALRLTVRRMKEAQDAAGGLTLWRDAA